MSESFRRAFGLRRLALSRLFAASACLAAPLVATPVLAQQAPPPAPMPAPRQQELAPGDSVRMLVWRQPDFSGAFYVSSQGTLTHPLLQDVVVAGVPIDTARARIAQVLKQYVQDPQFIFQPFFRVMVAGEVRGPGIVAMPALGTVLQAIAAAGGPTETARLNAVTLVRDGRTVHIDLTNYADPWANSLVISGDRIVVPQQNNFLRNYLGPVASVVAAVAVLINVLRH